MPLLASIVMCGLVGVNYDGVEDKALKGFITQNNIRYYNLKDDPGQALGLGDLPGIPTTFIFDSHGRLYKTLYGPQTQNIPRTNNGTLVNHLSLR